jgi:hypothetical protein
MAVAVAGHQMTAKWLLIWIFDSSLNPPADLQAEMFHHYTGNATPIVNVAECIQLLTAKVDRDVIFNDDFIRDFMAQLQII